MRGAENHSAAAAEAPSEPDLKAGSGVAARRGWSGYASHHEWEDNLGYDRSGRVSGVDRQYGAGDVAAAVSQQIFHHAGDIVRLGKPA
jgi:hypothetical protein